MGLNPDVVDLELQRASLMGAMHDLVPAYIAYVDTDLRYLAANRMYQDRFGRPHEEIVGRLVEDVTGTAFENVAGYLRGALGGVEQSFEPLMISVNGVRTLSVRHLPHRDANGLVVGVVVFGYDITEQRQAEAALVQSEKLAAVGRLASSIAHEINNPLEAVTNLLYLIETMVEDDPLQVRKYTALAQEELARVSQITTQTLQFFRQSTARREINMAELMDSVLALYAGRLLNSSIVVQRRFRPGALLQCYDGELRQALNNLIANAIDAMRQGGVLRVRVRRASNPKTGIAGVRVTVADTGPGIPLEVREKIFTAFFTTKGISGTGLGLWITRELVEKQGGTVQMSSRLGRGTVFVVFVPDGV
jgi:PAS domain S-box-containing protein